MRAPRSADAAVPVTIGEALSIELGRLREPCPEHAFWIGQEGRVHFWKELLKLAEMDQDFGSISSLHRFPEAESPSIGLEIAQLVRFLGLDERGHAAGHG